MKYGNDLLAWIHQDGSGPWLCSNLILLFVHITRFFFCLTLYLLHLNAALRRHQLVVRSVFTVTHATSLLTPKSCSPSLSLLVTKVGLLWCNLICNSWWQWYTVMCACACAFACACVIVWVTQLASRRHKQIQVHTTTHTDISCMLNSISRPAAKNLKSVDSVAVRVWQMTSSASYGTIKISWKGRKWKKNKDQKKIEETAHWF